MATILCSLYGDTTQLPTDPSRRFCIHLAEDQGAEQEGAEQERAEEERAAVQHVVLGRVLGHDHAHVHRLHLMQMLAGEWAAARYGYHTLH